MWLKRAWSIGIAQSVTETVIWLLFSTGAFKSSDRIEIYNRANTHSLVSSIRRSRPDSTTNLFFYRQSYICSHRSFASILEHSYFWDANDGRWAIIWDDFLRCFIIMTRKVSGPLLLLNFSDFWMKIVVNSLWFRVSRPAEICGQLLIDEGNTDSARDRPSERARDPGYIRYVRFVIRSTARGRLWALSRHGEWLRDAKRTFPRIPRETEHQRRRCGSERSRNPGALGPTYEGALSAFRQKR